MDNYLQDDNLTFLEDLIEGGWLTLTCGVNYTLTSSRGKSVELVELLADDSAWSIITTAERWSMSSRLQWLLTVGLDLSALPTEFFCHMYEIARG